MGPYGFIGDRTFCLLKTHVETDEDGKVTKRHETMLIGYHLQLSLFKATVNHHGRCENADEAEVVISWEGKGTDFDVSADVHTRDEIRFPLKPLTEGCEEVEVDLHTSRTKAFDLGDELSSWFADRLCCSVRLVYIGNGSRPVLGSLAPNSQSGLKRARLVQRMKSLIPGLSYSPERLAFNDIAHYLVVTEESNNQVSSRLDDGCKMDVTKFRPNVVVKGSSAPFEEDFWGELTFEGGIQMPLTANCYRCQSITVDYETGKTATDDRGMVWKKLNKDRRVDAGAKYSPVFGRYGYCFGSSATKSLYIGQKAAITHINPNRTIFGELHYKI